jgi:hypothetical protein
MNRIIRFFTKTWQSPSAAVRAGIIPECWVKGEAQVELRQTDEDPDTPETDLMDRLNKSWGTWVSLSSVLTILTTWWSFNYHESLGLSLAGLTFIGVLFSLSAEFFSTYRQVIRSTETIRRIIERRRFSFMNGNHTAQHFLTLTPHELRRAVEYLKNDLESEISQAHYCQEIYEGTDSNNSGNATQLVWDVNCLNRATKVLALHVPDFNLRNTDDSLTKNGPVDPRLYLPTNSQEVELAAARRMDVQGTNGLEI